MLVSTEIIVESALGLEHVNIKTKVDPRTWADRNPADKIKPAIEALRKHRPFETYRIIHVCQTVIDAD